MLSTLASLALPAVALGSAVWDEANIDIEMGVGGGCRWRQQQRCETGFTIYEGGVEDLGNDKTKFCYIVAYDLAANCPSSECSNCVGTFQCMSLEVGNDFCTEDVDYGSCTATKSGTNTPYSISTNCHVQNDAKTGVSGVKFSGDNYMPKQGETWTYCFETTSTVANPISVGTVDIALKLKLSDADAVFTLETIAGPVCNYTETGSGSGDPHFVGFNGEGFDFMGIPDRFYNIFTSNDVNVNAHFAKTVAVLDTWNGQAVPKAEYVIQDMNFNYLTLMNDIGVMVGEHTFQASVNGTALFDDELLSTSDARIAIDENQWFIWRKVEVEEEIPMNIPQALIEEWYSGAEHQVSHIGTFHLDSFDLLVKIVKSSHLPGVTFIDVNFLSRDTMSLRALHPHGVIGQTAQGTAAARGLDTPVVGADADYEVDGLFATNSVHNKFLDRKSVMELFNSLDTNGDGELSLEEIADWATEELVDPVVDPLFASVDTNKNGAVSLEEFFRG